MANISTHAPRTGSDSTLIVCLMGAYIFQPTLPARGATVKIGVKHLSALFQPTLPARGATRYNARASGARAISTHAPRTGSDYRAMYRAACDFHISTHAPRTGSDAKVLPRCCPPVNFNPRSPHGERPQPARNERKEKNISTHAPRTGSDQKTGALTALALAFQPTLPARGATM